MTCIRYFAVFNFCLYAVGVLANKNIKEAQKIQNFIQSKPINYKKNEKFKKTQDINPIKLFSYQEIYLKNHKFLLVHNLYL